MSSSSLDKAQDVVSSAFTKGPSEPLRPWEFPPFEADLVVMAGTIG